MSAPPAANPLRSLEEHSHEVRRKAPFARPRPENHNPRGAVQVYCVSWNLVTRDQFLSASWDDTARLWSTASPRSVRAFGEHAFCVYSAAWNPRSGCVFATASGDCSLKVWDARQPYSAATLPHAGGGHELLTVDWNAHNEALVATGGVDRAVRVWDLRAPAAPLRALQGHSYAVRRVRWSPWAADALLSASYDMTACLWDVAQGGGAPARRWEHHTEFVVGIDASPLVEGMVATCGWDGDVAIFLQTGQP